MHYFVCRCITTPVIRGRPRKATKSATPETAQNTLETELPVVIQTSPSTSLTLFSPEVHFDSPECPDLTPELVAHLLECECMLITSVLQLHGQPRFRSTPPCQQPYRRRNFHQSKAARRLVSANPPDARVASTSHVPHGAFISHLVPRSYSRERTPTQLDLRRVFFLFKNRRA